MITDELKIAQAPERLADTLDKIELIALYTGMPFKDASGMRLLAEELISATKNILDAYEGRLWMETSEERFTLHMRVAKPASKASREKLIALSAKGESTPPKGLFARLGAAMEKLLLLDEDELSTTAFSDYAMFAGGMNGVHDIPMYTYHYFPREETVSRANVKQADELDGIEKNIINAIVDDIQVTVRSGNVEIIAIKNLKESTQKEERA